MIWTRRWAMSTMHMSMMRCMVIGLWCMVIWLWCMVIRSTMIWSMIDVSVWTACVMVIASGTRMIVPTWATCIVVIAAWS